MGLDYSYAAVERTANGFRLIKVVCKNADRAGNEHVEAEVGPLGDKVLVRIRVNPGGVCQFSYGADGKRFTPLGGDFTAREGKWIGAKVGLFCLAPGRTRTSGYADFDWFRVE